MSGWEITYYNGWEAEFGSRMPAMIMTDWIYTDKDLQVFQNWLNKKGRSNVKAKQTNKQNGC